MATLFPLTTTCSPTSMLIGAGAEVGSATMEERSYGTILDDASIETQIKGNLFNFSTNLFVDVNVTVKERSVFLTGSVPTPELRIQAVRIAWQSDGIREIKNEIQIYDRSSLLDVARDKWISAKLRFKLTLDRKIRSINYSIDTVNRHLYLMGVATSASELKRVFAYARSIRHVRKIVSYVRVKNKNNDRGSP
ncbi:MAG: BON domain-containing protein [Pseudomonadota bacterium]|nr:BON domain-containing protein [Pseudomonadota bacterium]